MEERIFSLDIGTRSVTGILLEKENHKFVVIDYYLKEHGERSMRDGQIHNVIAVSDVIKDVKKTLEQHHGKLDKVSVAAAGRALKTIQAEALINLDQHPITDNETIKHLELSAVQAAQQKLASLENDNTYANYYCVGYSVLHYSLDNEQIGSLIEQNGNEASVEIIATFLPSVVVESLLAALEHANLEMEALTLEPIAAIDVLIPESMRRLNVALVDIGAGTSDIAITDKGTVVAYGMVPTAGDEITEAISDQYLLDFPIAEQTKRNIVTNGDDIVQDILGFESTIHYETLVGDIKENIDKLACSISSEILELNSQSPKAVMLIGGGSLTPEISSFLAAKLQLPENRVALRSIDAIQDLKQTEQLPTGPDFVTPIGIAIAAKQNPVHYISVKVNDKTIRMFEMKQLTIGDCLIQAGIDLKKHYGKPGAALIIIVNKDEITLPGEYGQPPEVLLNNKETTVDTLINNGDEITVKKGNDGKEPHVTIKDLFGEGISTSVYFNDKISQISTVFYVNNRRKQENYVIQDNDVIVMNKANTVEDFLTSVSTEKMHSIKPFIIYVNNHEESVNIGETHVYLNGHKVERTQSLKQNDRLTITTARNPTVHDMLDQLDKPYWVTIRVTYNDKPVLLKQQKLAVMRNQAELSEDTPLHPNDHLEIKDRNLNAFIFQDIFRYVDVDLTNATGDFQLYKNNHKTTFYETIEHGDTLLLDWGSKK